MWTRFLPVLLLVAAISARAATEVAPDIWLIPGATPLNAQPDGNTVTGPDPGPDQYREGYRQLLAPDFVLDVSAYNRDKLKDITSRKLAWEDPTNPGAFTYLNTFTNADFGTIRGIDVRIDRRFGQVFDATLGYSYQDARNTGTDPFTYVNVFARLEGNANVLLGLPPNPAQAIRLTEENRKHNITGNFSLQFPSSHSNKLLANFGLFGTLRVRQLRQLAAGQLEEGFHLSVDVRAIRRRRQFLAAQQLRNIGLRHFGRRRQVLLLDTELLEPRFDDQADFHRLLPAVYQNI